MTSVRSPFAAVLVFVAAAAVALRAQETAPHAPAAASKDKEPADAAPAPVDWTKEVERACTSPRYGLRFAASRKVASGGAAAVEAVRAFVQQRGANALPVALVEAFAEQGGNDAAVLWLLEGWAKDREFYWRAQAMRGLALRAETDELVDRFDPIFREHVDDPAWLTRVYARFGEVRVTRNVAMRPENANAGIVPDPRPEPDPRARTKLAALELAPRELLAALGDERTFLGDPWGRRRAAEAFQALKQWAGTDCGYRVDATFAQNRDAIDAFAKLVRERTGTEPAAVEHLTDPAVAFAGGIEVLSCARGDLFVRWTGDGTVLFGLDAGTTVRLREATWKALAENLAALRLQAQHGVVICDKLRFVPALAGAQSAIAPGAMPAPLAEWLQTFAAAVEEAGAKPEAAALRDRLQQFVPH